MGHNNNDNNKSLLKIENTFTICVSSVCFSIFIFLTDCFSPTNYPPTKLWIYSVAFRRPTNLYNNADCFHIRFSLGQLTITDVITNAFTFQSYFPIILFLNKSTIIILKFFIISVPFTKPVFLRGDRVNERRKEFIGRRLLSFCEWKVILCQIHTWLDIPFPALTSS